MNLTGKTMGNRINKLEKRLREAQARRDYATAACLMQELQQARQAQETEERVSLNEMTMGDEELRSRLCKKMIEMTVCADLLYLKAMEFQEALPKDVVKIDYIERMKRLVKDAHDAVAFIDLYGLPALSEHYGEVVDAVEQKTMYNMANVVANTVRERIGIL